MIPDKRKEVDKALRLDERQQLGEKPRYPKTGDKSDSVKHRLDEAESLLTHMAHCLAELLSSVKEFKDDEFVRKHWFVKWRIGDAAKLIAKADRLVDARKALEGKG